MAMAGIGIQFVRDRNVIPPSILFSLSLSIFFFNNGIGQTYAHLHSLINSSLLQQTTCGARGVDDRAPGKIDLFTLYRGESAGRL